MLANRVVVFFYSYPLCGKPRNFIKNAPASVDFHSIVCNMLTSIPCYFDVGTRILKPAKFLKKRIILYQFQNIKRFFIPNINGKHLEKGKMYIFFL